MLCFAYRKHHPPARSFLGPCPRRNCLSTARSRGHNDGLFSPLQDATGGSCVQVRPPDCGAYSVLRPFAPSSAPFSGACDSAPNTLAFLLVLRAHVLFRSRVYSFQPFVVSFGLFLPNTVPQEQQFSRGLCHLTFVVFSFPRETDFARRWGWGTVGEPISWCAVRTRLITISY